MCGIVGSTSPSLFNRFPAAISMLAHRGPDDSSYFKSRHAVFGYRRLAIIEKNLSDQPVQDCEGDLVVFFNGEIYNYRKLAEVLISRNHSFPSVFTDAAVIPHLREEFGRDFVKHLDGMFAIAIWNRKTQELELYRDSIGIKPLYYSIRDNQVSFSSEIKSLRWLIGAKELEKNVIIEFIGTGSISAPNTIFEHIKTLKPGHRIIKKHENYVEETWNNNDFPLRKKDYNSLKVSLDELLKESVDDQLSHGDISAILLSGGLDSSLLAAIIRQVSPKSIDAYHLEFKEAPEKVVETQNAIEVAEKLNLNLHKINLTPEEFFNSLDNCLDHAGQPFAGVLSTYFIAQEISKNHKACLTGDGADELFGSYNFVRQAAKTYYEKPYEDVAIGFLDSLAEIKMRTKKSLISQEDWKKIITSGTGWNHLRNRKTNLFDAAMHLDQLDLLPDQVLHFSDHLGMAHSLEIRPPFLSKKIINYSRLVNLESLISPSGKTKVLIKELAGPS